VVWFLVDGLPFWLVERYARQSGRGSHLARFLRNGHLLPLRPVYPNCQTPPSLATLFSGEPPAVHGVLGYDLPRWDARDLASFQSAFEAPPPAVRFIWDDFARQGRGFRLCHVPFCSPRDYGAELVGYSYGFGRPVLEPTVLPVGSGLRLDVADAAALHLRRTRASVFRLRAEASPASAPQEVVLSEGDGFQELSLGPGLRTAATLRRIGGELHLLLLGAWRVRVSGRERERYRRHRFPSPFFGKGLSKPFRDGRLGPSLHRGGDGRAEELLWETLEGLSRRFTEELSYSLDANDSDFVLVYQPFFDLLLHEVVGHLDESMSYFSPRRRNRVERLVAAALDRIDGWLGELCRRCPAGVRPVVSSDHGMAAVDRILYPNELLAREGWLQLTGEGRIDAWRSHCFLHPAETGVLCFRRDWLREQPAGKAAVLGRLADVFADAARTRLRFCDVPAEHGDGLEAVTYVFPGPGVTLKAQVPGCLSAPSLKTGDHSMMNDNPQLDGIFLDPTGLLSRDRTEVDAREVRGLLTSLRELDDDHEHLPQP